jgi:hypothetical protein
LKIPAIHFGYQQRIHDPGWSVADVGIHPTSSSPITHGRKLILSRIILGVNDICDAIHPGWGNDVIELIMPLNEKIGIV